jgi:hypothetical protein
MNSPAVSCSEASPGHLPGQLHEPDAQLVYQRLGVRSGVGACQQVKIKGKLGAYIIVRKPECIDGSFGF